jgi:fatty acid desaturase
VPNVASSEPPPSDRGPDAAGDAGESVPPPSLTGALREALRDGSQEAPAVEARNVADERDPARATARPRIDRDAMRELTKIRPWRTAAAIATDYTVAGGAIAAAVYTGNPVAYILAGLVVAGRQHSLLALMHDASHYTLARNKNLNDLVGNVLCAWPMLMDVGAYRYVHFLHHKHVGEKGDPDFEFRSGPEWTFPQPKRRMVAALLKDLFGLRALEAASYFKYYGQAPKERRAWMVAAKVTFYAALFGALWAVGGFATWALLWVLPALSALKCFVRIREIAEHYGTSAEHDLNRTRTTKATALERLLISPRNLHFHLEHHLFPGIPWHNLPAAHAHLMKDARYAREAHVSNGYVRALGECVEKPAS